MKIFNYYQLDPKDTEHNAKLATDVMHQLNFPVYVYPDDYDENGNIIDEKSKLEQLPPPPLRVETYKRFSCRWRFQSINCNFI